jgi:hypothetical protein
VLAALAREHLVESVSVFGRSKRRLSISDDQAQPMGVAIDWDEGLVDRIRERGCSVS